MAGVPVITFRRGCTGYLVGANGGLVIEPSADFALQAANQIATWIGEPSTYQTAVLQAHQRGEQLHEEAEYQLLSS